MGWPAEAVRRLAEASRPSKHRRGQAILSRGNRLHAVHLVVEGTVHVSLSAAGGRTVVFAIARPGAALFGVGSLVDGSPMSNDVVADEPVTSLAIPVAAVRAELARTPELWESIAREITSRARFTVDQLSDFLFEPLRSRVARLLLALAASTGADQDDETVSIGLRLPQERIGEMLGVSRQTAAALVREMVHDGLVQWRYGGVTLLDLPRLRSIAEPTAHGTR